jgi:hypothetical protein
MTDIYSNIDQARAIAKRLIRHNDDVRRAEVKRDICLYKYLESIYELDERLRNMPPLRRERRSKPSTAVTCLPP